MLHALPLAEKCSKPFVRPIPIGVQGNFLQYSGVSCRQKRREQPIEGYSRP
jgi:hypothetical protein